MTDQPAFALGEDFQALEPTGLRDGGRVSGLLARHPRVSYFGSSQPVNCCGWCWWHGRRVWRRAWRTVRRTDWTTRSSTPTAYRRWWRSSGPLTAGSVRSHGPDARLRRERRPGGGGGTTGGGPTLAASADSGVPPHEFAGGRQDRWASRSMRTTSVAPSAGRSGRSTGSTPTSGHLGSSGTALCRCSPTGTSR